MSIDAGVVKKLRDACGAGMMDCKMALVEAQGDMEEALKLLRKKGMASADKKSARAANEGAILAPKWGS
jgi:elongation factor Ts